MDAEKRRKLMAVGYIIQPCCGLCAHGEFSLPSDWGTCTAHQYQHEKHTGDPRNLSVSRLGWCPTFQPGDAFLGAFAEFLADEASPGDAPAL